MLLWRYISDVIITRLNKADNPLLCGLAPFNVLKALRKKNWAPPERKEFCFQIAFRVKTAILTPATISRLAACPNSFGPGNLPSQCPSISQSLSPSPIYVCVCMAIYTCTNILFCFSGKPWQIQCVFFYLIFIITLCIKQHLHFTYAGLPLLFYQTDLFRGSYNFI